MAKDIDSPLARIKKFDSKVLIPKIPNRVRLDDPVHFDDLKALFGIRKNKKLKSLYEAQESKK